MPPRQRSKPTSLPSRVEQRSKSYRVRVYVDGAPKWHKLNARTIAEVWAEVESLKAPDENTVGAGIKRYVESKVPELIRDGRLSQSTWRTEKRRCEALVRVFGHMSPDSIKAQHLYKFADLGRDGWRKLKRFSAIWRYLLRWGMATNDPFHRFDWPIQRARTRYVRDDEITLARTVALQASESRPSALIVWAALLMIELTGRRVTDVRTLSLFKISDDGVRFKESKTGKQTTVSMSPALNQAIEDIKAKLHPLCPKKPTVLIPNRDGDECSEGSLNQAFQRLRPEFKKAGLEPFQLRDLRAKYGTDHEDGRRALRHSSEAVFEKHYNRKGATVKPLK